MRHAIFRSVDSLKSKTKSVLFGLAALSLLLFPALTSFVPAIAVGECTSGNAALDSVVTYDSVNNECDLDTTVSTSGPATYTRSLHIGPLGKIVVNAAAGLTLNITGDLEIDTPSGASGSNGINADVVNINGRPINITASRNVILHGNGTKGAVITSSRTGIGDAGDGGGNITIKAGARDANGACVAPPSGVINLEAGSKVLANTTKYGGGDIVMNSCHDMNIDGVVESHSGQSGTGAVQPPGGGPITLDAACDLSVTGTISSAGSDSGADLVHLSAGCNVTIYGLVESTGNGAHAIPNSPVNHCYAPSRPDKNPNSTTCVEIWAGDSLIIDHTGSHNGEISVDHTGNSNKMGWIDLFARGDIQILNDKTSPFAVHANPGTANTQPAFDVTVKSKAGNITATGHAIQTGKNTAGNDGGHVVIQAAQAIDLDTATIEAVGDFTQTGGFGTGGTVTIRSFSGNLSWQNGLGDVRPTGADTIPPINVTAPSAASGDRGVITFQNCTGGTVNTSGTTFPFNGNVATTPQTDPVGACGGAPTFASYVILPLCVCPTVAPQNPHLTLVKHVINDNGGTANASEWTLTAAGLGGFSGQGSPPTGTDASIGQDVIAGIQYNLSESGGPSNYSSTGDWVCQGGGNFVGPNKITLANAENATCTITNDDIAPKLHLRKIVINDHGGQATVKDFTLTADGTGNNDISGTSPVDSDPTLKADTFDLSETTVSGYAASAWDCQGGSQNGASIKLEKDEEATCTITNRDIAPKLHLRKIVINDDGGKATIADFTLTADGTGNNDISGTSPVDSDPSLKADTFALSETTVNGYTASAWECVGGSQNGSNIKLDVDEEATCTITNNDVAGGKGGGPSLTLGPPPEALVVTGASSLIQSLAALLLALATISLIAIDRGSRKTSKKKTSKSSTISELYNSLFSTSPKAVFGRYI